MPGSPSNMGFAGGSNAMSFAGDMSSQMIGGKRQLSQGSSQPWNTPDDLMRQLLQTLNATAPPQAIANPMQFGAGGVNMGFTQSPSPYNAAIAPYRQNYANVLQQLLGGY